MTKPANAVSVSKQQYLAAPPSARYIRDIGSTRVYFVDTKAASQSARRAA